LLLSIGMKAAVVITGPISRNPSRRIAIGA